MDDFISCTHVLNCIGRKIKSEKVLKNKDILVYLFSSSTCQEGKELLPKLKEIYFEIKRRGIPMEIFYVPSDTDCDVMIKDFKDQHHGWYALPVGENTIVQLQIQYNVTYEPQIIVVTKDGRIVTKKGANDILELGKNVIVKWMEPQVI